jgi:hypothetical protein
MTGPPAVRPETQEARGAGPRSRTSPNPNYVRIVNRVRNDSGVVKRKRAVQLVNEGRAQWVGADQIRLVSGDPHNRADAADAARSHELAVKRIRRAEELRHVPVMRPMMLLIDRSAPTVRHYAGRSGPVRSVPIPPAA